MHEGQNICNQTCYICAQSLKRKPIKGYSAKVIDKFLTYVIEV